MSEIDWTAIRADYIAGTAGYRKLAEKYGVSVNAVSDHAKKGSWPEKRAEYRDKRGTDLVARYARADKRKMEAVFRATERMADTLDRMTEDPDQFRRYLVKDAEGGELREQTTGIWNTRSMRTTVKMLREMTDLIRVMNRIPTQAEAEQQHVARRRIEIEEAKRQNTGDENETGVILLGGEE